MDRSIIILSGGLDSAVSAVMAQETTSLQLALFFDYGQRASEPEFQAALQITQHLHVPLKKLGIPWLAELGQSSLTHSSHELPEVAADQLDDSERTTQTAKSVWVPNRNGIFLNMAAAFAESLEALVLVTGFNAEEAATFPDNSAGFVAAANTFFSYSTANKVRVVSYTQPYDKIQIVQEGLKRDLPFELLWSCYTAGPKQCGRCESCQRSIRAYRVAGIWERMKKHFDE